jgi:hypothetical protein
VPIQDSRNDKATLQYDVDGYLSARMRIIKIFFLGVYVVTVFTYLAR